MPKIPRDKGLDSTLALSLDPYRFIAKRCRRHGADLFQTRILLQKTICMTGPETAELFYSPERFLRHGAPPRRVEKTLFGKGGVQGLDDEAHRHRKQMFMSLMAPERIAQLTEMSADKWRNFAAKWASKPPVVLYDELREMLTRTVCAWSGVPLEESEIGRRTKDLTALFEYAGNSGPKHWRARLARKRANHWIKKLVQEIRAGHFHPPETSAAYVIAIHRDPNGQRLDAGVAAVELLNVLRPTVAVAVYITFVAHALHEHPECRQKLQESEDEYSDAFVQEVRRYYPFFPSVVARVRRDFEWNGYRFPQGTRTVLDLYGTNHDPRTWEAPEQFRPERFRQRDPGPFDFIPQGGGDHHRHHRCPGEWIAIELMKVAANFLARRMAYEVPPQDLQIDYSRLPALPRSGVILSDVRTDL